MRIDLYLVPGPVSEERLADKTIVLIDVLRASTTVCKALQSGARAIIPVEQPGEAAEMRDKIGVEETILGGERGGIKIDNFTLGNSPLDYTPEAVAGKIVILTTTNGTRAYACAKYSKNIITGGLVNVSRVAAKVAKSDRDLVILCAGDEGDFSIEDTLCGGMLIHKLMDEFRIELKLNDAASLALLLYRNNSGSLAATIASGEHGRLLAELGFADDVRFASEIDSIPVLPVLKNRKIVLEEN